MILIFSQKNKIIVLKLFVLKKNYFRATLFINLYLFIMKKFLLFLILIMTLSFPVQAGYIIRGIVNYGKKARLENYTLTFGANNQPISAGSMYTNLAPGYGNIRNTIVLINSGTNSSLIFPILLGEDWVDVEVRDFHCIGNERYVLCGTRRLDFGLDVCAFVAIITGNTMRFYEYLDADIFHSICTDGPMFSSPGTPPSADFYACGAKNEKGVIVLIDRISMQPMRVLETEIPWVYHKIISYRNPITGANNEPRFIVSGRDPECDWVGFSIINGLLSSFSSHRWVQQTELDAHVVVSAFVGENNNIVLASSKENFVTLYPVSIPPLSQINAYKFIFEPEFNFFVRDIGMNPYYDAANQRIHVAGYLTDISSAILRQAWFGNVGSALSTGSIMFNNNYVPWSGDDQYEHHKIRYYNNVPYTGGKFSENGYSLCALFATPTIPTYDACYYTFESLVTDPADFWLQPFVLNKVSTTPALLHPFEIDDHLMDYYADCLPFKGGKGGDDDPEYSMTPPENETEITNFYDRITVKDTPSGTNYQIYSVTGQLIQTGTTSPDISTLQLSKGMYILRLETGKALKFVK